MSVSLDQYQTLAVAVVVLFFGQWLCNRVKFLKTFCIPAPVAGGFVFAILTTILHVTNLMDIDFDDSLREVAMVFFFTSVGFQANLKVLKQGGKDLAVFLVMVIFLIVLQNVIAVGAASAMGLSPLIGLTTGSIPMVGGHGTAGAFGPVLEDFGVSGATTMCTAAATFGLIAGSSMGGPLGNALIQKNHLSPKTEKGEQVKKEEKLSLSDYAPAVYQIILAAGIGTVLSWLLSRTGMTFPVYIGAMIAAAVFRNISEYTHSFTIHMDEINDFGSLCLSLFLGIAMITLKFWQLADLAGPLVLLLGCQTVFMFVYTRFVVFRLMGGDYDAAVIAAGVCGFGMGATPNAMANMSAITNRYGNSIKAYLLIPIVGSLFADFINSLVITVFINLF